MPQGSPLLTRRGESVQRKPWEKYGISRAAFSWRKRYGDLPQKPARKKAKKRSLEELIAAL